VVLNQFNRSLDLSCLITRIRCHKIRFVVHHHHYNLPSISISWRGCNFSPTNDFETMRLSQGSDDFSYRMIKNITYSHLSLECRRSGQVADQRFQKPNWVQGRTNRFMGSPKFVDSNKNFS
jgi:hypothetical protein